MDFIKWLRLQSYKNFWEWYNRVPLLVAIPKAIDLLKYSIDHHATIKLFKHKKKYVCELTQENEDRNIFLRNSEEQLEDTIDSTILDFAKELEYDEINKELK
jgi:hypothetical protein